MSVNIYTVLIIIFTIILTIGLCLIVKLILNTTHNKTPSKTFYITASTLLTIGTIGSIICNCLYENAIDEKYQIDIENALQSGYTIYIDGSKTDAQQIDIKNYHIRSIEYDDNTKKVYISTSSHHNWRRQFTRLLTYQSQMGAKP